MITIRLSQKGQQPIYEFLYQSIKQGILDGNISPAEHLPSKRSLAKHLNISVITVENAYAQLALEGYIYAVEKKGYFVQQLSDLTFEPKSTQQSPEEPEEREYFADFKANRIGLSNFPVSTWSRLMRQTLSSQDESLYKTVPYNGLLILRRAIADYLYQFRGMQVSPQQIIIGAGTEYLYSRLIRLFGPDSVFALEDPGYQKFAEITAHDHISRVYIPIDYDGLSVKRLRQSQANIIHVSPCNHFPTGIVMPVKRRQELLEWAYESPERYIIEDDYDCEMRYSGHMISPIYTVDGGRKVIYMNTFSKSLVPSLRISYMVLPQTLLQRYIQSLSFYSCTVSSFEQYTLAQFISQGFFERQINRLKNYYKTQRNLLLQEIQNSPLSQISYIMEQNAGTHFLMSVDTTMNRAEILEAAEKQDIHVSLLSDYCSTPIENMDQTLVINYAGIEREKLGEVVMRIYHMFRA